MVQEQNSSTHSLQVPTHEVVTNVDPRICAKNTAWITWKVYPEVTKAFEELQLMQIEISEITMQTLERFVALLYDHTSDIMSVTDSRKYLFILKSRSLGNLLCTYSRSTEATHQTSCVPVYLLEESTNSYARASRSCKLGMEKK